MEAMRYLAIRRDNCFSPNSVAKDLEILKRTCELVKAKQHLAADIRIVDECVFQDNPTEADVYLTMARQPATLHRLLDMEHAGRLVCNTARGVLNCRRSVLDALMRSHQVAMPPTTGNNGYWLKRGDAAAQSKADVVYCKDGHALDLAIQAFKERGIEYMVTSAHMVGDLIKFYGVGNGFFRFFYPSDDGITKFGDEQVNGKAHHYAFSSDSLHREVVRLSDITGVAVYGGDAVIDEAGRFYIIDFNDWPSFSRCKEEAAEAISDLVTERARQASFTK